MLPPYNLKNSLSGSPAYRYQDSNRYCIDSQCSFSLSFEQLSELGNPQLGDQDNEIKYWNHTFRLQSYNGNIFLFPLGQWEDKLINLFSHV